MPPETEQMAELAGGHRNTRRWEDGGLGRAEPQARKTKTNPEVTRIHHNGQVWEITIGTEYTSMAYIPNYPEPYAATRFDVPTEVAQAMAKAITEKQGAGKSASSAPQLTELLAEHLKALCRAMEAATYPYKLTSMESPWALYNAVKEIRTLLDDTNWRAK